MLGANVAALTVAGPAPALGTTGPSDPGNVFRLDQSIDPVDATFAHPPSPKRTISSL